MPESRTLTPAIRALDCERCGAPLELSADGAAVTCSQCAFQPLFTTGEADLLASLTRTAETQVDRPWAKTVAACTECGARLVAPLDAKAVTCKFCGSSLLGELQDVGGSLLPQFYAQADIDSKTACNNAIAALRAGRFRLELGSLRPSRFRKLVRYGVVTGSAGAFLPVYVFTVRARLRGAATDAVKLPPLVALQGLVTTGSEIWGAANEVERAAVEPGERLAVCEATGASDFLAADISPVAAFKAIAPRVLNSLQSAVAKYVQGLGGKAAIGALDYSVIGVDYRIVAAPVHIVIVGGRGEQARFLVNAVNGEVIGPPGRVATFKSRRGPGWGGSSWREPKLLAPVARLVERMAGFRLTRWMGYKFWVGVTVVLMFSILLTAFFIMPILWQVNVGLCFLMIPVILMLIAMMDAARRLAKQSWRP